MALLSYCLPSSANVTASCTMVARDDAYADHCRRTLSQRHTRSSPIKKPPPSGASTARRNFSVPSDLYFLSRHVIAARVRLRAGRAFQARFLPNLDRLPLCGRSLFMLAPAMLQVQWAL
jgi:hypothetical protein